MNLTPTMLNKIQRLFTRQEDLLMSKQATLTNLAKLILDSSCGFLDSMPLMCVRTRIISVHFECGLHADTALPYQIHIFEFAPHVIDDFTFLEV